jgi:hypothetical protein
MSIQRKFFHSIAIAVGIFTSIYFTAIVILDTVYPNR